MTNFHIKKFFILVILIVCYSCTDDTEGSDTPEEINPIEPTLSISPHVERIEFSADGLTATGDGNILKPVFTVSTNQDSWNIKKTPYEASWCIIESNGNSFSISATENPNESSPQTVTIIISAGSAEPIIITINQHGCKTPDIYILGLEKIDDKSIYKWRKNKVPTAINSVTSYSTRITDMVVSKRDVYTVGYEFMGSVSNAFYFKNATKNKLSLSNSYSIYTSAMEISGDDIHIVGEAVVDRKDPMAISRATTGVYWKNGVPNRLKNTDNNISLTDIAVNENKVCISGYEYQNIDTNPIAKYWENNNEIVLGDSYNISYAYGVAIAENGDVHVIGEGHHGSNMQGLWWINGKLHQSFDNYKLSDITISGNDVYITGYMSVEGNSVYFVNGMKKDLEDASNTFSHSISVLNKNVYVAGTEIGRSNKAIYWINGEKFYLTDGTYPSEANTIFVHE